MIKKILIKKFFQKLGERTLVIPFTGDVNFSESEFVDRLIEIFGEVEIEFLELVRFKLLNLEQRFLLNKSKVITMHVTTPIDDKKLELQKH